MNQIHVSNLKMYIYVHFSKNKAGLLKSRLIFVVQKFRKLQQVFSEL